MELLEARSDEVAAVVNLLFLVILELVDLALLLSILRVVGGVSQRVIAGGREGADLLEEALHPTVADLASVDVPHASEEDILLVGQGRHARDIQYHIDEAFELRAVHDLGRDIKPRPDPALECVGEEGLHLLDEGNQVLDFRPSPQSAVPLEGLSQHQGDGSHSILAFQGVGDRLSPTCRHRRGRAGRRLEQALECPRQLEPKP
mmetsp:Transcript_67381/g.195125  ORF Transcript_67381/g.195125 Transcript_67381/m.195125 type:complete len:204 (-) Transcript_67381:12-623(-)